MDPYEPLNDSARVQLNTPLDPNGGESPMDQAPPPYVGLPPPQPFVN
jgi:hypothetical protein